ncbi:MAG: LysM peptidoglycan-binding domain-containing protein [Bacteroidetes bacterium]|nr:LysM peptidoglycan-binding domain-containing protein [Bacteroidota bacterium]
MRFFAAALIFFGAAASHAQAPQVPHKMHFADMTLAIRDDARREIQHDVDALTRHSRYFQMKVERAKTYFPLISKIFEDEGLPDDFKYLVIQESSLVPDAVSVSNAVGFWQFKDFTAMSMGLRVDGEVDERMNIASATRGAAAYLKQNNAQFDNWLLALQAYQMGAGGLKRSVGDQHYGKRHMEITSETYWYVKKFIAYKVAFEGAIKGEPQQKIYVFESKKARTLAELATELKLDESTLREYNKWALRGRIPDDKSYVVIVPTSQPMQDFGSLTLSSDKSSRAKPLAAKSAQARPDVRFVNGLRTVKALKGESLVAFTDRAGITLSRFLKFNEISIDQTLEEGAYYFLEKKKSKGEVMVHKVKPGEDLWSISQLYGIRVTKLEKWNRRSRHEKLDINAIVKLNPKATIDYEQAPQRPSVVPAVVPVVTEVSDVPTSQQSLGEPDSFNWEIKAGEAKPTIAANADTVRSKNEISQDAVVPGNDEATHMVQKGETLYSIAKLHSIAVTDILKWNEISINAGLSIGQKLFIKEPASSKKVHTNQSIEVLAAKPEEKIHRVGDADTLYSIARQYGVTIKDLMDWNQRKDLTIKPGETLKIIQK